MSAAPRSAQATAAAIVLCTEAILLFFFTLLSFGLELVPRALAFPLGIGASILLFGTVGLLRYRFGYALGWALQLGLIALGLLHPVMYVIGGLAAATWLFAMVKGKRVDDEARSAQMKKEEQ